MSGLLALLDDVAAIAKVAAASVDDVVGQAVKASSKAAGAVIDDAAVTPKYVHGFSSKRELPIVWKIARGSIFNKVVILLPAAVLLSELAPWLIAPLLMIGGAYLCFEGAEKTWHWLNRSSHQQEDLYKDKLSDAHLEETKVSGAIKTDFILSAEIMTIVLSSLPDLGLAMMAGVLAVSALIITAGVYGAVAVIVKSDDVGLHLAATGRTAFARSLGCGLVRAMPGFMQLLVLVGTLAMLWVGGSILVHGLEELGLSEPGHAIHLVTAKAGSAVPSMEAALEWMVAAFLDAILGLVLGLVQIPLSRVLAKAVSSIKGRTRGE